jgi:ABC-type molybdenum transport system ATPase subunit/photorepair protein PhrA
MPVAHIVRQTPVVRSARVLQLEGLFEIPPTQRSEVVWEVNLPLEEKPWNIGLIVGPSGCGKTTIAREMFGAFLVSGFAWPADRSLVDGFPEPMSIKDITALLSSVGFSSPPSWLRPFSVLSNGEQFRATIARALAENRELTVIDEFTSVVDRTVAQIGSAAVAKTIRRREQKLVAVSCHYDILDWLQPDWTFEPASNHFQWRCLRRRPDIHLDIVRVHPQAWQLFKRHHYLDTGLHRIARCFVAFVKGQPAAFASAIHMPHPRVPGWREHRTVCLPDFQGVGIGNALSEFVASLFVATGKRYYSVTSNPAMVQHRARSPLWHMHRRPSRSGKNNALVSLNRSAARTRFTAGFRYVGPARVEAARALGLVRS